jgi:hypothetical protein
MIPYLQNDAASRTLALKIYLGKPQQMCDDPLVIV